MIPRVVLALALASCTLACLPIHSALQAGAGQFELLTRARPLDEAIASPSTRREARPLLAEVPGILRFGEEHGLARTTSYGRYVELGRPAPVWVVSACAELSFTPKTWSFPIAGNFPYLGWFEHRAAEEFAQGLTDEGLDVEVRPARAYSTLGWFDDPILSSMIAAGPLGLGALADDLLHESTHATLHLAGQAPFNEGLASFVGTRLATEFMLERRGAGSPEQSAFESAGRRHAQIEAAQREAAHTLDALYRSSASDRDKRIQKRELLQALGARIEARRPITNATLQQHLTYQAGAEGFPKLLSACAGAWSCFWERLRTLKPADFSRPQQEDLEPILRALLTAPDAARR